MLFAGDFFDRLGAEPLYHVSLQSARRRPPDQRRRSSIVRARSKRPARYSARPSQTFPENRTATSRAAAVARRRRCSRGSVLNTGPCAMSR
jgi:hypothetical protein